MRIRSPASAATPTSAVASRHGGTNGEVARTSPLRMTSMPLGVSTTSQRTVTPGRAAGTGLSAVPFGTSSTIELPELSVETVARTVFGSTGSPCTLTGPGTRSSSSLPPVLGASVSTTSRLSSSLRTNGVRDRSVTARVPQLLLITSRSWSSSSPLVARAQSVRLESLQSWRSGSSEESKRSTNVYGALSGRGVALV